MRLDQTDPSHAAPPGGNAVRLSEDELTQVVNDAIARQSEAERAREETAGMSTLEDAIEIARSLDIPEEHVLAAAEELQRRKFREVKRAALQGKRRTSLGRWAAASGGALALLAAAHFGLGPGFPEWVAAVPALVSVPAALLALRRAFSRVPDREVDRADLLPQAGTCRVCGRPAYSPSATFCDLHRYRGPDSGGASPVASRGAQMELRSERDVASPPDAGY
jgi:hypothetical protein